MEQMPLLVDSDGGIDDALALLLLLSSPSVQLEAITVVFGNVDVQQAMQNLGYVLELCASPVPLYRGAEAPVDGKRRHRDPVHGSDGLGDLGYRPSKVSIQTANASNELRRRVAAEPGRL